MRRMLPHLSMGLTCPNGTQGLYGNAKTITRKAQHNPVTSYDKKKIAAYREASERMALTVLKTVKTANGPKSL